MFYVMLCVTLCQSSFAIILMGKREMVALFCLSSWCLVIVVWLFLTLPWVGLQFVIVVIPDHTHLLFWYQVFKHKMKFQIVLYISPNITNILKY